jgi:hypothetical protein
LGKSQNLTLKRLFNQGRAKSPKVTKVWPKKKPGRIFWVPQKNPLVYGPAKGAMGRGLSGIEAAVFWPGLGSGTYPWGTGFGFLTIISSHIKILSLGLLGARLKRPRGLWRLVKLTDFFAKGLGRLAGRGQANREKGQAL